MYHVGRLGSYITRGVYTVSGPFHPFGGAVDIIVVEQPDGTFKSSPWYVRFGKFQGVLKAKEKEVTISVNGVDADFHMYLDQRGEAYFLREVEGEEGAFASSSSSSSSSDETSENSPKIRRPMKSKSCNYDGVTLNLDDQLDETSDNSPKIRRPVKSKSCNYGAGNGQTDAGNGKITPRTRSRRSRILGLVFGRRSMKEESNKDTDDVGDDGIVKISPLERAEIAANLLDVKWSTNLSSVKPMKDNVSVSFANKSDQNGETISESDFYDTRNVDASEVLGANGIQSSACCQNSENLVIGLDSSKEESEETLNFSSRGSRGPGEVRFCAETLRVTTDLLPEGAVIEQAEQTVLESVHIESSDNHPQQTKASPPLCSEDEANLQVPLTLSESNNEKVNVDSTLGLVEAEPINISSVSEFSNPAENDINLGVKVNGDKILTSRESVIDVDKLNGDYTIEASSAPVSESSEEEQFPFSDFGDSKYRESEFIDDVSKEDGHLNEKDISFSSQDCFLLKNQLIDTDNLIDNSKIASNAIPIHVNTGSEAGRLSGSLPNMWSQIDNFGSEDGRGHLSRSLDSNFMSLEWRQPSKEKDCFTTTNSNGDNEYQSSLEHSNELNSHLSENIRNSVVNSTVEISLCRHLLHEGMGAEAASRAFEAEKLDVDKLTSLGPNIVKNNQLIVRIGSYYFPWDAAAPIVLGIAAFGSEMVFEPKGMIPVDRVEKSLEEDPSKADVTSGGSWGIWPFRRSRSRKIGQLTPNNTRNTDVEKSSESYILDDEKNKVKPMMLRKKIRANTPTSDELASLNLKEGSNVVTFTFSTAMLGRQKVDARIFLWKWNTRIVISDVDGTITKSDVLGQFMPLVGVDWSQTGVAHLFSAIKENGYQLLFLSARAISQAYITRQFLVNLKQDGKALPDGPVVISPDGLFPSLFREVIRRAPHEFKIACLEDIKALFPSDCNPFYAGFGNRDTDEFSYLKVGIPKGKIFTINPKGEVSVHGRHHTKSYSSLHALVHGMFPAMSSSEQEDYNSWNFWRLPPPDIDV